MKQIIRINAEYEFSEKEEKEWLAETEDARQERIEQAEKALAEMLENFSFLELKVEMKTSK